MDLSHAVLTDHAMEQAARRRIDVEQIRSVLAEPLEVLPVRPGRVVAHRIIEDHLLRVFVDVDRTPAEVVTVYQTSKIGKYRSYR